MLLFLLISGVCCVEYGTKVELTTVPVTLEYEWGSLEITEVVKVPVNLEYKLQLKQVETNWCGYLNVFIKYRFEVIEYEYMKLKANPELAFKWMNNTKLPLTLYHYSNNLHFTNEDRDWDALGIYLSNLCQQERCPYKKPQSDSLNYFQIMVIILFGIIIINSFDNYKKNSEDIGSKEDVNNDDCENVIEIVHVDSIPAGNESEKK